MVCDKTLPDGVIQLPRKVPYHIPKRRDGTELFWVSIWSILLRGSVFVLLCLTGCGRVVTITPTPGPLPTATFALTLPTVGPTPTPLAANYTPAPPATPTEVQGPIVYTVESGDNLSSIAQLYNVSTAALQEANGILDPRTLQIGQELLIPVGLEELSDAFTTSTPTPLSAQVQGVGVGENDIGGLWVLGEVLNTDSVPLEQIRVRFSLIDQDEQVLAETTNLAALDIVGVNKATPFVMLINDAPKSFAHYRTELLSAVPAYLGGYYLDLEIRDLQGLGEGGKPYEVSGRVYNYGNIEAVNVQVVLTAYDDGGRVVAVRKISPQNDIVPRLGETSFNAILAPQGGTVASVNAVAIGRRLQINP